MNYIKIKPIQFGELQEKTANAITWMVNNLGRNAQSAIAECGLIHVNPDGSSIYISSFQIEIDYNTLQAWGADDSVIDNKVLSYSPLFELE